jgi:hypothetical protein
LPSRTVTPSFSSCLAKRSAKGQSRVLAGFGPLAHQCLNLRIIVGRWKMKNAQDIVDALQGVHHPGHLPGRDLPAGQQAD